MVINQETRDRIQEEYESWEEAQYNGKTLDERRALGQFFTAPQFTVRMLEKFSDLEGYVIDPTCGAGGLLAAAIIAGADPKKCHGVELDEELVETSRKRLAALGVPEENILRMDALQLKDLRKFKRVIMNPPYGSLHLPILANTIECLGEDWEVVSLQPYTWIEGALMEHTSRDFKKYGELIQRHISSLDRITALEGAAGFDAQFFTNIGVYNIRFRGGEYDLKKYAKEMQKAFPSAYNCLLNCYKGNMKTIGDVAVKEPKGEFVKLSRVHGSPNRKDFYDLISPKRKFTRNVISPSPSVRYLNFDTDEEAENFRKSVVNNTFFKFLSYLYKFDQNLRFGRYPWVGDAVNPRTKELGYKGEWTDDDLFDFFNVGEDERNKIKEIMKEYLWELV